MKNKEAALVSVVELVRSGSMKKDKQIADIANQSTQLGSNVTTIMQALKEIEARLKGLDQRLNALEKK